MDLIRAKKLFEASLQEGDIDLLKEMKRIKSGGSMQEDLPDTVDGANG